ncbi:MAG: hypothetical protein JW728_05015 [Candidatus Aureabacteria bacterium]|nr:hypothetical protein [Candidatus Auribacterota bacterium]
MKKIVFLLFFSLSSLALCQPSEYSTPEKTFELYKKAAGEGDVEQYLKCLDRSTAMIWSDIALTPELIKREAAPITGKEYKITYIDNYTRRYAIINFSDKTVDAPPYILCQSDSEWKIDFKAMTWRIIWDGQEYRFIRPFEKDDDTESSAGEKTSGVRRARR